MSTGLKWSLVLCVLSLATFNFLGCSGGGSSMGAGESSTGMVRGQLSLLGGTDGAQAGFRLQAPPQGFAQAQVFIEEEPSFRATVGVDGTFTIPGVPAGVWHVISVLPGRAGQEAWKARSAQVVVSNETAAPTVGTLSLALAKNHVAGVILDPEGQPVPNLQFILWGEPFFTDAEGKFVSPGFPDGPVEETLQFVSSSRFGKLPIPIPNVPMTSFSRNPQLELVFQPSGDDPFGPIPGIYASKVEFEPGEQIPLSGVGAFLAEQSSLTKITWQCSGGVFASGPTPLQPRWVAPANAGVATITLTVENAKGVKGTARLCLLAKGSSGFVAGDGRSIALAKMFSGLNSIGLQVRLRNVPANFSTTVDIKSTTGQARLLEPAAVPYDGLVLAYKGMDLFTIQSFAALTFSTPIPPEAFVEIVDASQLPSRQIALSSSPKVRASLLNLRKRVDFNADDSVDTSDIALSMAWLQADKTSNPAIIEARAREMFSSLSGSMADFPDLSGDDLNRDGAFDTTDIAYAIAYIQIGKIASLGAMFDRAYQIYPSVSGSPQVFPEDPVEFISTAAVSKIACGGNHSLVIKSDGSLWSWGSNSGGELGNRFYSSTAAPVRVEGIAAFSAVAGGNNHSMGLKTDGTVWSWGNPYILGRPTDVVGYNVPGQIPGLSGVNSIACGEFFSVILKSDGSVLAWGKNDVGQLGNNSNTDSATPTPVLNLSGVVAVAAGSNHALAVKSNGTVWAWGGNSYGQLGDGGTTNRTTPVQVVGLTNVAKVAAGAGFSVALANDGTVWCWGTNSGGQLGDGTKTDRFTRGQVPGLSGITAVAAGQSFALALKSDGTVWTWGYASGMGWSDYFTSPKSIYGLSGISEIAAGGTHCLARNTSGKVWGWGRNGSGEVGDGTRNPRLIPAEIPFSEARGQAAPTNLIAHAEDGQVTLAWEPEFFDNGVYNGTYNIYWSSTPGITTLSGTKIANVKPPYAIAGLTNGQAYYFRVTSFDGTYETRMSNEVSATPGPAPASTIIAVAGGYDHSVGLRSDGSVWAWGNNSSGQLGDGTLNRRSIPGRVLGLANVTEISASDQYSMALKSDGTVWAWGNNSSGQLGDGTQTFRRTPIRVLGLTGVTKIFAATNSAFALTQTGEVWAWGNNYNYTLGDGSQYGRAIPKKIVGLSSIQTIGVGDHACLAIQSDGTLLGWGGNRNGELATWTNPISVPYSISDISGAQSVVVGKGNYASTICRLTDQSFWGWGTNQYGELASTTIGGAVPTQLPLVGVSSVHPGVSFYLGLKPDGTVLAWGLNNNGQLGNASVGGSTATPTMIPGLTTISSVSPGFSHAFALQSDGKLWAWGKNDSGQLGDGTLVNRTAPVAVWW